MQSVSAMESLSITSFPVVSGVMTKSISEPTAASETGVGVTVGTGAGVAVAVGAGVGSEPQAVARATGASVTATVARRQCTVRLGAIVTTPPAKRGRDVCVLRLANASFPILG